MKKQNVVDHVKNKVLSLNLGLWHQVDPWGGRPKKNVETKVPSEQTDNSQDQTIQIKTDNIQQPQTLDTQIDKINQNNEQTVSEAQNNPQTTPKEIDQDPQTTNR